VLEEGAKAAADAIRDARRASFMITYLFDENKTKESMREGDSLLERIQNGPQRRLPIERARETLQIGRQLVFWTKSDQ
jgi:hypothetical protein